MTTNIDLLQYNIPTGGELRIIREYLGLSKVQVQEQAGFKTDTLRNWEDGNTSPRARDLRTLLSYYQLILCEQLIREIKEEE